MAVSLTALDRIIAYINPSAGLARTRARAAMRAMGGRSYEGASKGRRTEGWRTVGGSANAANQGALPTLRERSRDLTRNNPYANKALSVIVNNTIGTGIVPRVMVAGDDQLKSSKKRAAGVAALWKAWAEATTCDADGLHDFYGLQALAFRTAAESGECLVRKIYRSRNDKLPLPLQIQILEPDFIDTSRDTWVPDATGAVVVQGVKFDKAGRRLGYMLYSVHPGDPVLFGKSQLSTFVPANEVIHLFRVDRPGQVRGVPWIAPVILRLRDFDEYEDAQLMRQKVAACFTVFVTQADGDSPTSGDRAEEVQPGMIYDLPLGKSVEFADPPGVDGYGDYAKTMLRSIASGLGITYESLTGDLSNTSFSSGRMGWLDFHRNIEAWRWQMVIPRFCDGVWAWFMEAAELSGTKVNGVDVEWTPPRREMINPTEEVKSTVAAVRGGIMSLPEAIRQQGWDPELLLTEISESNTLLDDLGLVLESDARKTTQAGQLQVVVAPPVKDNNGSAK